ncbi:MAG: putative penicillin-binding protein [Candidatus Taylorbacteria bacterium]|nr:putative penicillin-binding protein [Candidatus Taylorbacteria bacterium]
MVQFAIMNRTHSKHAPEGAKHHRRPHFHRPKFLSTRKKVAHAIVTLGVSLVLLFSGIAILWISTLQLPDLSTFEARKVDQSTKIYDRTGTILLYDVHQDTKRTAVAFEDISPLIKKASVAIEDTEFYQHFGIKPTAILRAIIADLTPGGIKQGGSTITQQVIKNSVLTQDQTITRKLKEWVLAIKIERVLTKDQILSTYLNESPYGGNIYGIQEASKTFFGKSAKDVTLAEAAYLAAIPQAPTYYSPYGKNKAALDNRQKLVLLKMEEAGVITKEEHAAALKEKVVFLEKNTSNIRAPHFVLMVRDALIDKYGEDAVLRGGLKVTTTLNFDMQQKAEKIISHFAPTLETSFGASNTAMVAIDPKTGDILTMVGSRDYYDKKIDGNFNIATAARQPGSTFKPFVYATAFMKGYTPDTILFDAPTEFAAQCTFDGKAKNTGASSSICYSPENYDGIYEGPITIRTALAQSRNIPAVKALYLTGIKDSIQTAENMGITSLTDPNRYGLTLVLGGGEVSLLELTSAYGVFADDGMRNPYRSVLKVEDANGKILEEAKTSPNQVITAQSARQISDILSDPKVRLESLNDLVNPWGRQVAIKTGTTNDYRDVWVEGYTPSLVVGAWAGKNNNTPMQKKVAGLVIAPVWAGFMSEVMDSLPENDRFKSPEPSPTDSKPVLHGIWKGGVSYFRDSVSGKLATEFTPPELKQEIVFNNVHTILYWLDKNDPTGPKPEHPENDPQFENWEHGVRAWYDDWAKSHPDFKEVTSYDVPKETDDIHTQLNAPKVSIVSPQNGAFLDSKSRMEINFLSDSKFKTKKVELYVNGRYIVSNSQAPFAIGFTPSDLNNLQDKNTLKIVVYDEALNRGEASVEFSVVK